MSKPKPTTSNPVYIVANPRGIPAEVNGERIPIFRQQVGDDSRDWYEGDTYDGNSPEEPLRRGFLVTNGGD